MQQTVHNCGHSPAAATADAGFWVAKVEQLATDLGIGLYVSTAWRKHAAAAEPVPDGALLDDADERDRMRHKLGTEEGHSTYAWRKATVEPVFGQIKRAQGFRRFLPRGMKKRIRGERSLVRSSHHLLKLFRVTTKARVVAFSRHKEPLNGGYYACLVASSKNSPTGHFRGLMGLSMATKRRCGIGSPTSQVSISAGQKRRGGATCHAR